MIEYPHGQYDQPLMLLAKNDSSRSLEGLVLSQNATIAVLVDELRYIRASLAALRGGALVVPPASTSPRSDQ